MFFSLSSHFLPSCTAVALAVLCLLASPAPTLAADNGTAATADAAASYKEVNLKELVARSRTEVPGQRIIFAPAPVRFRARLAAMPAAQKAEYLMAALAMMKFSNPPQVSQRIGLDFGGDKALAAYIEDSVAVRLASTAKAGQELTFYAFHVYNNNRGPALLVTSFAN